MNFCYTGRADTSAPAQGKIIEGAEPMATMNSLTDIWSVVMDSLSQELTQTAINTWFSDCTPIEINNNTLIVHTTSDFKRSIIQSRFEKTICAVLYDLFSCPFELVVLAGDDELLEYREKRPSSEEMPEMDGYTFDRFIVGPSNKFAHAAAIAVSQNPGKAYNPLLIYGNSGLGKTHLLLAIGQTIRHNNPSAKIAYVKGEEFVNQMVKSIGTGTAENFRQKYRNADLLLMDDIQFIAGKDSTQEEFFHTFNSLYSANKQIIISSDKPPKDMEILDERFRSRFEWGLIVDITLPDYETRMAILHKKEDMDGYNVSEDVIKYIANNIKSNIRELEGAFNKVVAYAKLEKKEVTLELAEQALKDIVAPNENKQITADYIISMVAEHFNVSTADLCGNKRSSKIVMPRQVAMYLCREILAIPLKNVGQYLGNRDHTTVMHGVEKIEKELQNNEQLQNTIDTLKKKINPQT